MHQLDLPMVDSLLKELLLQAPSSSNLNMVALALTVVPMKLSTTLQQWQTTILVLMRSKSNPHLKSTHMCAPLQSKKLAWKPR